jgi:hypothetical protein
MFFTNAKQIKFQDTVNVIRAYPDWKLVFYSGGEAKWALKAESNADYANFWARAKSSPQDSTYNSIEEGLSTVAESKTVMHIDNDMINGYFVENPTHVQILEKLVTEKNIHKCIAFPFNSSLKHMFAQGRDSPILLNS